eukprot:TRINITY_DN10141_c1_g1_i1.p1 TRINITY_DN10141_c1_g1~~TRINITY_DN10141_c1_g1_i1.p1  ORF type:complete len:447 (-),score=52.06 TRINITY_DN10141_c1_g1_i1:117-1358(-)
MTVLPLAFWVPCRIPASELFPVRHAPLNVSGSISEVSVPRPPVDGVAAALKRWQDDEDPLVQVIRGRERYLDTSTRRRSVYHGTCRESLQRFLQRTGVAGGTRAAGPGNKPPLPSVLPELLPMHDISRLLNFDSNLELLVGAKQLHKGPGLELYQDKIELSQEFRRRGLPVPIMFYGSYDHTFNIIPLLEQLEAQGIAYVAKAAHMCCSKGVFVMDGSIDRLTNKSYSHMEIQTALQRTFVKPFAAEQVDTTCGDWGTVEAGKNPGILVEEMLSPSIPLGTILAPLGGGDWITPDILACHLVWSAVLQCVWEIKLRKPSGEDHVEPLGVIFRDGSCFGCRFPVPFGEEWGAAVELLEGLLPHSDYLRITLFIREGRPVVNEIEYTTGGLEVVPVRISKEWSMQWLEGYYRYHS